MGVRDVEFVIDWTVVPRTHGYVVINKWGKAFCANFPVCAGQGGEDDRYFWYVDAAHRQGAIVGIELEEYAGAMFNDNDYNIEVLNWRESLTDRPRPVYPDIKEVKLTEIKQSITLEVGEWVCVLTRDGELTEGQTQCPRYQVRLGLQKEINVRFGQAWIGARDNQEAVRRIKPCVQAIAELDIIEHSPMQAALRVYCRTLPALIAVRGPIGLPG